MIIYTLYDVFIKLVVYYSLFWSNDASFLSMIHARGGGRIPLRLHQSFGCHIHITLLEAFFVPLNIYPNAIVFLFHNPRDCTLTPLQDIIAIITVHKAHVKLE